MTIFDAVFILGLTMIQKPERRPYTLFGCFAITVIFRWLGW